MREWDNFSTKTHFLSKNQDRRKTGFFLILSFFFLFCLNVWAEGNEEPAINVIFIMDLSGSMRDSDPAKVSLTSVAIFADFLGESSSQVGYVLFSDDVRQNLPLTPVEQAKSRIRNNLLTSQYGGNTNVPAALDNALNLFRQSNSTNPKVAILFTDGNVYMPPNSGITNRQGEDRCRELAQAYKNAGIPLYTVGLNYDRSLNMAFIRELSNISSPPGMEAKSYEARTNWDIPDIFSRIYINLFNGNSDVGLSFNSIQNIQTAVFYAEERIYELNILLIHNRKLENLTIRQPDGRSYQDASFLERDGYSFVKIRYPDVGNWEFSFRGAIVSANKLVRYVTQTDNYVTVRFDTDGGSLLDGIQVPLGNVLRNAPIPTKEGFSFEGWYLNEARTRPLSEGKTFSADTLLYAMWIPRVMRNITLSGDGVATQTLKFPEGDRFHNHIRPPSRRGFAFIGWYLPDGTRLDENSLIAYDLTLIARWEKIKFNLFLSIFFFIISIGILLVGMITYWREELERKLIQKINITPAYFSAGISAAFTFMFSLACWAFIKSYIVPVEILSKVPARQTVGSVTFVRSIDLFVRIGCLLFPIVLNLLLATVLPLFFVPPASRFGKDRQYLIHLLISLVGLIWPSILWIMYGAGSSMTWLLCFSFVVYSVNFFLAALLFQHSKVPICKRFGIINWWQQFKVYPVSMSEYMKTTSSCQLPKRLRRIRTRSSLKNSSLLRAYALAFR